MQSTQTRRRLLATLSSAAAASAFGGAISAQEAPPETKTIRLIQNAGICVAPQYLPTSSGAMECSLPRPKASPGR